MAFRFLFATLATATLVMAAAGEGVLNIPFYMHDHLNRNKDQTAFPVAGVNGSSSDASKFGTLVVISDVVTKRPQITEYDTENILGRAQGTYVNTNPVTGLDFLMVFSLIFQNAEYNGSTLEIQGTDRFDQPHREYAVVGGTGKFRFARGYAVGSTVSTSGENAILKINATFRTD